MSDRGYVRLNNVYDSLNDYFLARIARGVNLPVVYNDIYNAIKDVPVEDVRPNVHGEWVDTQPDLGNWESRKGFMAFYCSACGHTAGKHKHSTYKFCPWCGADMRPSIVGEIDDAR